ncbi:MAG: TonB-dependent receptor [Candidatus Riflebacteria bacterium]|nr:TonB-dependent receptor [Candidatus Riflebacteria bacterium]
MKRSTLRSAVPGTSGPRLFAAGLVWLTISAGAVAAPEVLDPIEVRAARPPMDESFDAELVRDELGCDLAEDLGRMSGITKIRKGGIASDIVIRGFYRDNLAVLIDGTRIQGACPNRMDPPAFHLDSTEVERVDVQRGPFDVRQAGCLGGVLEVRTRDAKQGFHGEMNLGGGSFDRFDGSGFLSYGAPRRSFLGGASVKRSDAYRMGDGRRFTELDFPKPANRYRPQDRDGLAYDMRTGWAKATFGSDRDRRFDLSYTRQEADDVLYPYLFMDAVFDDSDQVNGTYRWRGKGRVEQGLAQWYWNRVEHEMDDRKRASSTANPVTAVGALPRVYSMRTLATSEVTGGRAEATLRGAGSMLVGTDFYSRQWNAVTTRLQMGRYLDASSVPDVRVDNLGFYAQQRRSVGKGRRLVCGVRVDLADSRARTDCASLYRRFGTEARTEALDTTFTGNVQYQFPVGEKFEAFVGVGHGARLPDAQERFFALPSTPMSRGTVGNPALKPVENSELDASLTYTGGRFSGRATVFYSELGEYIIPTAVRAGNDSVKTYRGVDARQYGVEATGRLNVTRKMTLTNNLTYTRGQNDTESLELPEMPPLRFDSRLRWDDGRSFVELEEVATARQNLIDARIGETPTPGWAITNLKVGRRGSGYKAAIGVINLLDHFYVEHLSNLRDPFAVGVKVPEPGRTVYATYQRTF